MPVESYTEYEKQVDGSWHEQHPKTGADNLVGKNNAALVTSAPLVGLNGFAKVGKAAFTVTKNAIGDFCILNCACVGILSSGENKDIAQIPEGFRPKEKLAIVIPEASSKMGIELGIDSTSGKINAFRPNVTGTAYIYFTISYYAD